MSMRLGTVTGAMLTLLAVTSVSFADPIDPAQAIAQKFYEADQPDPLPPTAQPVLERPGLDYEMDMLRRARTEEAERQKTSREQAIAERIRGKRVSAEETPPTVTKPAAAPQPAAAMLPGPWPEPQPRTMEPLARAEIPAANPPPKVVAQSTQVEPTPDSSATRATVLLVLDPDDGDRAHVKPDPIICFDQQCWISNGLEAPAKPMPRSEAIALKTTETMTGDSCSGKSACAFRNVAFAPDDQVQVVEVGESRGVADGAYTVAADKSCRKDAGDLICNNTLVTHAFRMWVVPETTAQSVGPSALEDAVANGLDDADDDNAADGK
jgi:hypothetical protein